MVTVGLGAVLITSGFVFLTLSDSAEAHEAAEPSTGYPPTIFDPLPDPDRDIRCEN